MDCGDVVNSIADYFRGIQTDIQKIKSGKENEETTNARTAAVALRIIGLVCAVGCVVMAISAMVTIGANPVSGLFMLIAAIVGFVCSHDLIVMGKNASRNCDNVHDIERGGLGGFLRGAVKAAVTVVQAGWYQTHPMYLDTWLIGPLYKCIDSNRR